MKNIKWYIIGFLAVILFLLVHNYNLLVEIKGYKLKSSKDMSALSLKIDTLVRINDSVSNELFIQTTNVTRYEIALDRLKEVDSVAAKKFEEKLHNIE